MPELPDAMNKGFELGQAVAEANRCLLCYDAPCSKGCPGGTDPGAFIKKFKLRNITGAIRTIKENNILGGACGVLCPTAKLCEQKCSATGLLERPIAIGKIQRCLIEHSWQTGFSPLEKGAPRQERVAIVGSGPAGLSCAAELAKAGFQVTIFEAKAEPGGVLRYGVPSYRFSPEFLAHEIADVKKLGVEIKCASPIRGKDAVDQLLKQGFRAVFLAPGLWTSMRLKENAGEIPGVFTATDFLCALREGRQKEMAAGVAGKRVGVIGGGSVAMDCVESALKLGAADVFLIYRRSFKEMPAEDDEKTGVLQAGAHLLALNQPVDYRTDASGKLAAIKLIRTELGEKDASGRRRPLEVKGSEWELKLDAVVEAIGARPAADAAEVHPGIKLSSGKLIMADPETGATSVAGVYAGGDIVRGPALIIEAIRDGKAAAKAIQQQLSSK